MEVQSPQSRCSHVLFVVCWDPPFCSTWMGTRNPLKNESWLHRILSRMAAVGYEWE